MINTYSKKRPLIGGRLLKTFQVRGYKKSIVEHTAHFLKHGQPVEIIVKKESYVPMGRIEGIKAIDGAAAAAAYARSHNVALAQWYGCGPRPEVVIRVSNIGERAP